jgi:cytochrome oxidase Cu insertion factor (SCO1/SenC/PrrC family)
MKLSPRAKLLLLMSLFALPIGASLVTYKFFPPDPSANYGELLLPPATVTAQPFAAAGGGAFDFQGLRGKWLVVASDCGACAGDCRDKLQAMTQARLALGRNAARVQNVFVADDSRLPDAELAARHIGLLVVAARRDAAPPPGAANDRTHIYLVDPRGNVVLRWPAKPHFKRMLRDLERVLKASQIG